MMMSKSIMFQAIGIIIASLLAFSGSGYCQNSPAADASSNLQQAAISAYNDISDYREYLASVINNSNLNIGYVSATITSDDEMLMQFELNPMPGSTFGDDTVKDWKETFENADLGTLTDLSYSVSNPGALEFSFEGPDQDNYGVAIDQFRELVASTADLDPTQVGDVALTLGSSEISLQFQVLPLPASSDTNCTFGQEEVDRISNILQSGALGEIDTVIFDSAECGHIDATILIANNAGDDAGSDANYVYARVNTSSSNVDEYDSSTNSGRRLHRRLQQWSCEFNGECDSGYCMGGGYCA